MSEPHVRRGGSGSADSIEALRAMLATMLGGAGRLSGGLGRVPALGEVARAAALLRQAVALDIAATARQARLGTAVVRTARRSTSLAFGLGRGAPRLARARRRRR